MEYKYFSHCPHVLSMAVDSAKEQYPFWASLAYTFVVGKSITTNPGYFSSGRFLNGEGVKRLLFSQLGSLVKG
jgi:hypothetical protein